jgi:hypothetical protein
MSFMNCRQQVIMLRGEVKRLEREKKLLEEEIRFLSTHRTLQAAMTGEAIVAKAVDGRLTDYASSHDIEQGDIQFEVKFTDKLRKNGNQKRWSWNKIFGEADKKEYHYLVLVGKKDPQWLQHYRDKESSPYVFFCIPKSEAEMLTWKSSRYRYIGLGSNPNANRYRQSFARYEKSEAELKKMFPGFSVEVER